MKKLSYILLLIIFFSLNFSQTTDFNFSTDIVSRYIWRGSEYGRFNNNQNSPHIQPTGALSITLNSDISFSLGFWGSYGFSGDYSESDLYVNTYIPSEVIDISITLNDYFYPMYGLKFSNLDGDGKGAHTLEGNIIFSSKKLPLKLMISNNIHNDLPGDNSLYIELGYLIKLNHSNLEFIAGIAKGPSIWHSISSNNFEFINIGINAKKDIKITESFSIPVSFSWIYNHHKKVSYLVAKLTL